MALAARRGPVETVRLLNDCFDCLDVPIEEHGVYVLKFIGDAILAFFPDRGRFTPDWTVVPEVQ